MADDPITVAHEAAIAAGEPGYADPETGFFVFTSIALRATGKCCGSGCRHCPFDPPGTESSEDPIA